MNFSTSLNEESDFVTWQLLVGTVLYVLESDLEKVYWYLWEKLAPAIKCITGGAGTKMISRLKKIK